ncbi:MAG: hypothetical protein ABFS14_07530 [Gemmatimonadota bacterium]
MKTTDATRRRVQTPVLVTLFLWMIALVTTVLIVGEPGKLTYLAPVLAMCMIGNIVAVRGRVP